MHLTIDNLNLPPEAIGTPDGTFVDVLQHSVPYELNSEAQVLIIGDKPTVREQFETAAQLLQGVVRDIITAIAGRKATAALAQAPEAVRISLLNNGAKPVRAILGDGTTDQTVAAGSSASLSALGYIELRELENLDESQLDGGTQPAVA